jgi:hypothetical protein
MKDEMKTLCKDDRDLRQRTTGFAILVVRFYEKSQNTPFCERG